MIDIKENESLRDKTSFRIGGVASYFVEVGSEDDVLEAAQFAKSKNLPVFILGDGTDILLSDRKLDAVVVRFENRDFKVTNLGGNKYKVVGGAGLNWDEFVGKTVDEDLGGIECLSGIPGTVGASPVQNIGAYGQEVKDTIDEIVAYDTKTENFLTLKNSDCDFSYRESIFKKEKGRYFILNVSFILEKGKKPTLTYASLVNYLNEKGIKDPSLIEVRQSVLDIRRMKLEDPKKIGNAGSFFKNPIVSSEDFLNFQKKFGQIPHFEVDGKIKLQAGWLIDKVGLKGKKVGGAMVSEKNALVIVNESGEATAEDVRNLSREIISEVKSKFGVVLEPEVQFINF